MKSRLAASPTGAWLEYLPATQFFSEAVNAKGASGHSQDVRFVF